MIIRPKLMILGHARHGKDTVAEGLQARWGYTHVSSSWFVGQKAVWPQWQKDFADTSKVHPSTFEEMYEARGSYRSYWYDLICSYNKPDRARLARELFTEYDMYVGLRNAAEFHAAKIQGLFKLAIWIDGSDRHPPEPASSCTVEPWMADYILDNNGTLEDLDRNLEVLYNKRIKPLEAYRLDPITRAEVDFK